MKLALEVRESRAHRGTPELGDEGGLAEFAKRRGRLADKVDDVERVRAEMVGVDAAVVNLRDLGEFAADGAIVGGDVRGDKVVVGVCLLEVVADPPVPFDDAGVVLRRGVAPPAAAEVEFAPELPGEYGRVPSPTRHDVAADALLVFQRERVGEEGHGVVGREETAVAHVVGRFLPLGVVPESGASVVVEDEVHAEAVFTGHAEDLVEFPGVAEVVVADAVVARRVGGPFEAERPLAHPDLGEVFACGGHVLEVAAVGEEALRVPQHPRELVVHARVERRTDVVAYDVETAPAGLEAAPVARRDAYEVRSVRRRGVEDHGDGGRNAKRVARNDAARMAPRRERRVAHGPSRASAGNPLVREGVCDDIVVLVVEGRDGDGRGVCAWRLDDGVGVDGVGVEWVCIAVRQPEADFEEAEAWHFAGVWADVRCLGKSSRLGGVDEGACGLGRGVRAE